MWIVTVCWIIATLPAWQVAAQPDQVDVDRLQRRSDWFLREGLPISEYSYTDPEINGYLADVRRRHRQEANRKTWSWVALAGGALISGAAILSCETGTDGSGCDIGGRGIPFFVGLTTGFGFRILAGVSRVQKQAALEEAHSLLMQ